MDHLLVVFIELVRSSTSSDTVGERKIVFLFSGPNMKDEVFFALTMFLFIFPAILVKEKL